MTVATVGLLFSDIEGSTRLLQQLGPGYADVLLEHRKLLRTAFASHGGEERGTEGDSFFVTFATVSEAVGAAIAGQRALASHVWSENVAVRVRMGVHVGEIQVVAGTIVGMAIHEAARISAVAYGGQVVVSAVAAHLAGTLPESAAWRDLGEHHLKDVGAPMHLMQLTHDDLARDFPPLRSPGASRNNLPAQASSFIGRAQEIAEIHELLTASRLVTITGPGGSGKSRIALLAAAEEGDRFDDGPWFVDLAPVSDPSMVAQQVAAALGLAEAVGPHLGEVLQFRSLLLLVDNCEHLVDSAAEVIGDILRHCPRVNFLATSREPLSLQGETVWRLQSLAHNDAVELFCERARAVNSKFALADHNRAAVDVVCERLDAIPLALELAAARLVSLSVEQLSNRLDQRFRLLAGGARGSMARHRTLQATGDWSYSLLDQSERTVLRRVSAFVGGFTLDAAEFICADADPFAVFDLVDRLVVKSLIVAEEREGKVRYRLLETIRQYALERLIEDGELAATRDAHVLWLEQLARQAEPVLWFGGNENTWLAGLDTEDGNLRAGLEWALENGDLGRASSVLFGVSNWYNARGKSREGLKWSQRLLAAGGNDEDQALVAITELFCASNCGRIEPEMIARVSRCAPLFAASARPWVGPLADAYAAAWSYASGDPVAAARAIPACERAVEAARQFAPAVVALTMQPLMWANVDAGFVGAARRCGEEALALTSAAGLSIGESRVAVNLARIAIESGDNATAWRYAERAVEVARGTSDTFVVIVGTQLLARLAEGRGDPRSARDLLASVLEAVSETQTVEQLVELRRDVARYEALASAM